MSAQELATFFTDPRAFMAQGQQTKAQWLAGLEALRQVDPDLTLGDEQLRTWQEFQDSRCGLILGPPGTGKTYLQSWLALAYLLAHVRTDTPCRILFTGFTRTSIANLLREFVDRLRWLRTHDHEIANQLPDDCVRYLGNAPEDGLPSFFIGDDRANDRYLDADHHLQLLQMPYLVVGATVWRQNSLIGLRDGDALVVPGSDGATAPLWDLVLVDEASQLPVALGLLAMAGVKGGARVLVAGDDQQLPPVRTVDLPTVSEEEEQVDSLYGFLLRHDAPVMPLSLTWRLNATLARFPAEHVYAGKLLAGARFRPANDQVAGQCLRLRPGWEAGLAPWLRACLHPDWPLVVLVHDSPPAGSFNPFEVFLAKEIVEAMLEALDPACSDPKAFWTQHLAVVSPHRAQNSRIRQELNALDRRRTEEQRRGIPPGPLVETVDRIQGQGRNMVVASYTVADAEFAVREGEFIFSPNRLNVTVTRARAKLVFIVSRRLLMTPPVDSCLIEPMQLLHELVDQCGEPQGRVEVHYNTVTSGQGPRPVPVEVFGLSGSDEAPPLVVDPEDPLDEGVRRVVWEAAGRVWDLWRSEPWAHVRRVADDELQGMPRERVLITLVELHRLGYLRLGYSLREDRRRYDAWFIDRWFDRPLRPWDVAELVDVDALRRAVGQLQTGRRVAYQRLQPLFDWMGELSTDMVPTDRLASVLAGLEDGPGPIPTQPQEAALGERAFGWQRGEFPDQLYLISAGTSERDSPAEAPTEPMTTAAFEVLNALEERETEWINIGFFDRWTTAEEALIPGRTAGDVRQALELLASHGYLMRAGSGPLIRYRSRFAELARITRYVKQRFRPDDAHKRPYLVRGLQARLLPRMKPGPGRELQEVLANLPAPSPASSTAVRLLGEMVRRAWFRPGAGEPRLRAFQERALAALWEGWLGDHPKPAVVTAGTGSGKTEAAIFPLMAGALTDALEGVRGCRVILVYPRVRLAENQCQRLADYLSCLSESEGAPTLTLGLQTGRMPIAFPRPGETWLTSEAYLGPRTARENYSELWKDPVDDQHRFMFPIFSCPRAACGGDLLLQPRISVADGATRDSDRLNCKVCDWVFTGWLGSKRALQLQPPTFLAMTAASVHGWLVDNRFGRVFGDPRQGENSVAPRAVVVDEIHLLDASHGAHVSYVIRRLLARLKLNGNLAPVAVGMSATLGSPQATWGGILGVPAIEVFSVCPEKWELLDTPEGREYYLFVQPEVESRSKLVAGASTTIQALMALAHNQRRRAADEGGFRALAFYDSIDILKRMHNDYRSAEGLGASRLPRLRTCSYPDERTQCCGNPRSCSVFADGECWYFAATDQRQVRADLTRYDPERSLVVCGRPVFSGNSESAMADLDSSSIVFATSSLEVGYDDPAISLVFQHYAPAALSAMVQRKGRAGRRTESRPLTAVTLSVHSPRDTWYYRRPDELIAEGDDESGEFGTALNLENHFVRRAQALAAIIDAAARTEFARQDVAALGAESQQRPDALSPVTLADAAALMTGTLGGLWPSDLAEALRVYGHADVASFLSWAVAEDRQAMFPQERVDHRFRDDPARTPDTRNFVSRWAQHRWIPQPLYQGGTTPMVEVWVPNTHRPVVRRGAPVAQEPYRLQETVDAALAFRECAPGNVTQRWSDFGGQWVPPIPRGEDNWQSPWLRRPDYGEGSPATADFAIPGLSEASAVLAALPGPARRDVRDMVDALVTQPLRFTLESAGNRTQDGEWNARWLADARLGDDRHLDRPVLHRSELGSGQLSREEKELEVGEKSRSSLRGTWILRASTTPQQSFQMPAPLDRFTSGLDLYLDAGSGITGLQATRVFWGADLSIEYAQRGKGGAAVFKRFLSPTLSQGGVRLHGYPLTPEGLVVRLNVESMFAWAAASLATWLPAARTQLRSRHLAFRVERECRHDPLVQGTIDTWEAERLGILFATAICTEGGPDELRTALRRKNAADLLERVFQAHLYEHPRLGSMRAEGAFEELAERLNDRNVRKLLFDQVEISGRDEELVRFLVATVQHALSRTWERALCVHGRADERRVSSHVESAVDFLEPHEGLGLFEQCNNGDGTVRTFLGPDLDNLARAAEHLSHALKGGCPNAEADAALSKLLELDDAMVPPQWREPGLALDLNAFKRDWSRSVGLPFTPVATQRVLGVLQGRFRLPNGSERSFESVARESFDQGRRLRGILQREPSAWELVTSVVRAARDSDVPTPALDHLLTAYEADLHARRRPDDDGGDPVDDRSVGADQRLADQVFRLAAPLCVDGCEACVGSGGLASRTAFEGFLAWLGS